LFTGLREGKYKPQTKPLRRASTGILCRRERTSVNGVASPSFVTNPEYTSIFRVSPLSCIFPESSVKLPLIARKYRE
jgi:hypothetical protein